MAVPQQAVEPHRSDVEKKTRNAAAYYEITEMFDLYPDA
jgi:hypothetical protein